MKLLTLAVILGMGPSQAFRLIVEWILAIGGGLFIAAVGLLLLIGIVIGLIGALVP